MAPAWRVLSEASHNPLYVTLFRFGRPSFDLRHTTQISSWHHRSSPYALLIAWMRVSTRSWHIGPYYPVAFDLPFTGRYPRKFVHPGVRTASYGGEYVVLFPTPGPYVDSCQTTLLLSRKMSSKNPRNHGSRHFRIKFINGIPSNSITSSDTCANTHNTTGNE
ncbi:hypothetical protein EV421DRAFT_1858746 [Armillaria borealis]|uniref:Uncharacterized protein n=1 Tax=Armillaria borealis TaxID=47425 RepID=A0AA39IVQ0_9AGAR|nr:hypothetical protein EV421DRAFT_1858746 [Armillaria borealis]